MSPLGLCECTAAAWGASCETCLLQRFSSISILLLFVVEPATTSTREEPPVCWQSPWRRWTWRWWRKPYSPWTPPKILTPPPSVHPSQFLTQNACFSMISNKSVWVDFVFLTTYFSKRFEQRLFLRGALWILFASNDSLELWRLTRGMIFPQ